MVGGTHKSGPSHRPPTLLCDIPQETIAPPARESLRAPLLPILDTSRKPRADPSTAIQEPRIGRSHPDRYSGQGPAEIARLLALRGHFCSTSRDSALPRLLGCTSVTYYGHQLKQGPPTGLEMQIRG